MNKFAKFTIAAAVGTSAFAASLPGLASAGTLDKPAVEPVTYAPAPVDQDWTGFYGGLNLGFTDINGDGGADGDEGTFGVHAGYDYDFGSYILGVEVEYDKLDIDLIGGADVEEVMRLKFRGGYDMGQTLIYATAGAARLNTSIGNDTGGFIGIGAAYRVSDQFIVGAELLGHRFEDIEGSGFDADATTFNLRGSFRF